MIRNIFRLNILNTRKLFLSSSSHCSIDLTKENVDENKIVTSTQNKVKRTDINEVCKVFKPGILSSMYVNKSDILQQLIKLGVKLYVIEKDPEAMKFILTLKFDDVKDKIVFLKDLGLETDAIGNILTKNPFILKESLDDLHVRINFLQYKKFTNEMIVRVVGNNAFWLTHSVMEIDNKLGFFQTQFSLTGDETRLLATKCPTLITYPLTKIKLNTFVIKEEMGFSLEEIKKILMNRPQLFKNAQDKLLKTFEYIHNTMKIPLETIAEMPQVLSCRSTRLKQRHLFLEKLGRAKYDCKKPNYVSLITLVSGSDAYFSTEVAKSTVNTYNNFLKSL